MPEMSALCQDGTGTPPTGFGSRAQQAAPQDPPQNFYGGLSGGTSNGYSQAHPIPPPPPLDSHYSPEGYGSFQAGQASSQHQMDFHHQHHIQQYQQQNHHHHHHQQQHQHQQQFPPPHLQSQHHWGYGMNGADIRGGSGEDHWGHGYYFHQTNGYRTQNPYGYQYRAPQHPSMDYGSPLHMGNEANRHNGEEEGDSPCLHSDEEGESGGDAPVCGPNNQGAKSLRPPYEWMKPSPSLPQPGKTRTKDKYRVVYSDHQRLELEKEFHFSKYITIRRKAEIAGQLGLSERQVKIWFQNRRAKERKQNKKREDQATSSQTGQSPGVNGEGSCKTDSIGGGNFIGDGPITHDMNNHHLDHHNLHQHMTLNPAQDEEDNHAHSFIPKLEIKEEDMSVQQEPQHHQHHHQQSQPMVNHHGTPLLHGPYLQAALSPQATPTAMTNDASLRTPPTMSTPTNPQASYHNLGMQIGRNFQHGRVMHTMDRFHSPNGNYGVSTSTPAPQHQQEEVAYRMPVASAADSSGNSMNLSGSSDSGIMS